MKKTSSERKPFFARFLEKQDMDAIRGTATLKFPSDSDEEITLKYPSDDDEWPTK